MSIASTALATRCSYCDPEWRHGLDPPPYGLSLLEYVSHDRSSAPGAGPGLWSVEERRGPREGDSGGTAFHPAAVVLRATLLNTAGFLICSLW